MKKLVLLTLSILYLYLLTYSSLALQFSPLLPYFLLFINTLAIIFYGLDKLAAVKGWQRTPEKHFYILAWLGAWPGSVLGQVIFHHKTSKRSFRRYFYAMVLLNLTCIGGYLYFINGVPG